MRIFNQTITGALANQLSQAFQLRSGSQANPDSLTLQANFTYGSGGTSADAYVQTSFDGGTTWVDIANFHFTTASGILIYNLSPNTVITTGYVPTDGTLAANTAHDGLIGTVFRVKWTTVGVYAGNTQFRIDAVVDGLVPLP